MFIEYIVTFLANTIKSSAFYLEQMITATLVGRGMKSEVKQP